MAALEDADRTELSPEEERLVRLLLSRFIGEMRGKRTSSYSIGHLGAALTGIRLPVVPAGCQALRRLGMKPAELDQRWRFVKTTTRDLGDEVLEEFVPRPFWPGLMWLVDVGPIDAWERLEAIVEAWIAGMNEDGTPRLVLRRVKNNRTREVIRARPLSEGSVSVVLTGINMLFWHLVELRKLAAAGKLETLPESLDAWQADAIPSRKKAADLNAKPANWDRSAPPLLGIRRLLHGLDREVRVRAGTVRGRLHSFKFLRDRAFIGAMVVVGGRRGSFAELRRGDFIPKYVFPDESVGPALVLTLGEGVKGRGLRRVKGIPTLVGEWIQEYVDYIGVGEDEREAPLWYPNIVTSIENRQPWSDESIDRHLPGVIGTYVDEDHRYSAHTLRHLAAQLAEFYGSQWISEHRDEILLKTTKGLPLNAVTFADILLDHHLSSVADAYRDLNNEAAREAWSRVAALGIWELVWGDLGARRGPDRERRREASLAYERTRSQVESVERRIGELKSAKAGKRRQAIAAAQQKMLTTEQLFVALLELDSASDDIIEATELLADARSEEMTANAELTAARDARVPVDDTIADEDIWPDRDIVAIAEEEPVRQPLRNWCTIREFREAFGEGLMPESTLYRWLCGRLSHPNGDPRNIFRLNAAGVPTALQTLSTRKRRILLDELNWSAIHPDIQERLNDLRLQAHA